MKPFQSKLVPYFETIRSLRRSRKSWREIAEAITAQGTHTCQSSCYEFYKRHTKRPFPLGWEDEAPKAYPTAKHTPTIPPIHFTDRPRRFSYDPKADSDLIN